MFETSKDLLFIVIAFCILWLTIFLSWMLWQFIAIISNARRIAKSVSEKLEKIDEIINLVKDKVHSSATYMAVLVEGVSKIVDYMKTKKSFNANSSRSKKKAKKNVVEE